MFQNDSYWSPHICYCRFFHNNFPLEFKNKTVQLVSFLKRKREKETYCEYNEVFRMLLLATSKIKILLPMWWTWVIPDVAKPDGVE